MKKLIDLSTINYNPIFERIVGRSDGIKKVIELIVEIAKTDTQCMIFGESGTGKELVARALHNKSGRREHPLVNINCAAIPEALLESELFGHEKDAFTGAMEKKIGKFELANDGTIFLDEISYLSLELQTKILRVIQEGEFERLGNPNVKKVDVRVIAATNRNLEKAIKDGSFREDLFYRLNVIAIKIPPLRERVEDIPLLISNFVNTYENRKGRTIKSIPEETMTALQKYSWPGNVRELASIIEKALILTEENDGTLQVDMQYISSNLHEANKPIDFDVESFPFLIKLGSANEEDVAELFYELSSLYRNLGGNGLQFSIINSKERILNEVLV